ncbi:hypothetical protein G6514_000519 [Epicoccum nigrum]|nr:hypothetical protein G6514_000519 [Epicoccum nigrum]
MDTSGDSDPANVAAVSGFYGPGAWAAWICSLTSAWYTLLLQPKVGVSSDLVVSLLYTNWAAVEFLKQLGQGTQDISQASLGAAATVTLWGWCHNILQINVCLLFVPHSSASRRRVFFALSGVFIPTLATLWIIAHSVFAQGTQVAQPFPKHLPRDDIDFWYADSRDLTATILGLAFHASLLALVSDMYWITKPGLL